MEQLKFSFPRELRLLNTEQFKFVFQDPYRVGTPEITILARKNNLSYPRLGLAIAKKNIKKAHQRNQLKRLCRESFRLMQHELSGYDFIVLAKGKVLELSKQQIRQQLIKLWKRYQH